MAVEGEPDWTAACSAGIQRLPSASRLDHLGSPGTRRRDETIKRRLYERSEVSEYWIVDPELEVVRIYQREGTGFGRPRELSREAGDAVTSPLFPQLELSLDAVFRS